ncbi:MAG: DUF4091 domain-containing protein [Planctomycetes bacterium]|nr:DUF4091 domain-containing protein [Planctomycetota bacterium]
MRILVLSLILAPLSFAAVSPGPPEVWLVDPLVKVFRDATPPGVDQLPKYEAEVARGEVATFQIVVRSPKGMRLRRPQISPFRAMFPGGAELKADPPRFVRYVPVDRPIQTPPKDQLRKPPADFPDPLLEVEEIEVPANTTQPIWITVPVPRDAAPGIYAAGWNLPVSLSVNTLILRVYPAAVGPSRLWVTNWFAMHAAHMKIDPKPGSPEYWALLRRYARNMAEHRQNVALISPLGLATFTAKEDGALAIDFSTFDRWVDIFTEEGVIGRIEGGHIGGRKGGWDSPFVVSIRRVNEGRVESASVDPDSPEADRFYARFFPALVEHLKAKGWHETYLQHLADEPIASNIASYRAMAALARKYAPSLRIVEACHTKDLVGSIDVWVPQLNYLHEDLAHYQARQKAGEEVWFYTCVFPQGEYANRFIEQPLMKTRLLHWINFRYGITGYLHWGYNHWTNESPFTHTTRPHGGPPYLPAGDAWIVYPGTDGPLDSIRHEAMRDGIADYELLSQLAERDRAAAERLAAKHILAFDRYDCDVDAFRATRRELLQALSKP